MNFCSKKASGQTEEGFRKAANAERDLEAYSNRLGLLFPIQFHSLSQGYPLEEEQQAFWELFAGFLIPHIMSSSPHNDHLAGVTLG